MNQSSRLPGSRRSIAIKLHPYLIGNPPFEAAGRPPGFYVASFHIWLYPASGYGLTIGLEAPAVTA